MRLDGTAMLQGTPEQVWAVITDPAVLARTIPGCQSLERTGEDSYAMVVSVGVGAVRGTYAGQVSLADKQHPRSYVMHASGAGGPGSVRATVPISLEAVDGGTRLTYGADAVVAGAVAGVGQRMIAGVAKRLAGQFFGAIDAELTGTAPAAAADVPPTVAAGHDTAVAGSLVPASGPARGPSSPGVAPTLLAAAGGSLLTLLAVWVGWVLGRR
ncbi:carbon monoxide dehydrogenase [Modestobacter sp. I12A-02628]|uniref:Carbon monoxide dehydrogenase subunit G n=1 Tax=Goekera deserti TaxID=2497753 RepID=A0A7K3WJH3_9ACTN|nr:carbon monoxide dehydrogenase subunit G [Goekera deserti]MPQ99978.1 carbon monoxide dehydrogenase [Goekera deserti]NDI49757.1 carbon monoxide dehydrogenase [Goekera deserti]NEL56607.1 carbon monoxide dehydrogenase subunit G [Goekera deserti]